MELQSLTSHESGERWHSMLHKPCTKELVIQDAITLGLHTCRLEVRRFPVNL